MDLEQGAVAADQTAILPSDKITIAPLITDDSVVLKELPHNQCQQEVLKVLKFQNVASVLITYFCLHFSDCFEQNCTSLLRLFKGVLSSQAVW